MGGSKAVNVPTDPKVKERDINAKLQLYGLYAAFAKGKVPSNKQVDVALNSALEWKQLQTPSKKLSPDGQKLVADLRDVIEKAKLLLLTKNDGNLLQDFIWQTQSVGKGDAKKLNSPLDKETAKQHGQQTVEGLRNLGNLLITNGQFRKLLSDSVILLRDIAGDTATKAATKVKPSEEQLAQIDQPAEDNTWHETPDFSKETLRAKVPIKKKGGGTTEVAAGDVPEGAEIAEPTEGSEATKKSLKEKWSSRVDDAQQEKLRAYRERTTNYFKSKLPKERRDQVIFRLKKLLLEIQGHEDYTQAIDTLLNLAEEYGGHSKNVIGQGKESAKDILQRSQPLLTNLKTLLERFANGTSADDLIDSINQIYRDANADPELRGWFKDVDSYIRKCLQVQGYVLEDDANKQWNKLYDRGHFLLRERYRNHTERIVGELKFLGNQFDEDPQNKAFAEATKKLFTDLGNDEDGKPAFKPHLLKDLSEVIIPGFFENVRYIPVPRIEYSDKMVDAVVENLVIEGDNLAPNQLEFGSDNYWRWGRRGIQNRNKNKVLLSVSGIQLDIRDVSYYIKKKEGFPSITDKGVLDIFLGGTGLSFKIAGETADKTDKQHFFKINSIQVDIKNMDIKLKKSNHKLLFSLFKPLLFKVVRPVLQKVIEKQIRDNVHQLDTLLYNVKQDVDRAQEQAKINPDPDNKQSVWQRYATAFKNQTQKDKDQKPKPPSDDKKLNIALAQEDSIFKDVTLPGGISSKASEYRALALKGEKWQSPVFSIGSAKETANLPSVSHPTRKPHEVNKGGVRDLPVTEETEKPATNGATNGANGSIVNQVTNAIHTGFGTLS